MTREQPQVQFALGMARRESGGARSIRRAVIAIAGVYLLLFTWNMYRRIWQVLRIEPRAESTTLRPSVLVGYDVITSGVVPNRIRLELVQGERSEVLHEQVARFRTQAVFDVRLLRYTPSVSVTHALLSRFQPGSATLRVTGFGSQKLLRIPAPRVAELQVDLQPQP